jgi:hypothetical protein
LTEMVVSTIELCVGEEDVQLDSLRLLRNLARTSDGFTQLENLRGGWQRVVGGGGIAAETLIHSLPGDLNNPGWTIAETHHMPALERAKLDAREEEKTSLTAPPTEAWTSQSLRQFMGLSLAGQRLAINNEYHDIFFSLMETLDLLPFPGEAKEDWFVRTRGFESENGVSIEDMVATVQEMKRREQIQKQREKQNLQQVDDEDAYGSVKELYVRGERITTELLDRNDASLSETLQY